MAKNSAKFIVELEDKITGPLKKVVASFENLEKAEQSLNKLKKASLGLGLALGASLGIAAHKAANFETAFASVKTLLTGTAEDVFSSTKAIERAAISWSSLHKQSSEEYLQGAYHMLSAGLTGEQAIAGTNQALALATATMGDATTATALLGTLYNNFGNKAHDANTEMTKLADTVTKTQQLFQIANLGQLNEGLKYAASSAQAFRVSFDQTAAVVGQLNTLGLAGSMAGTAFNAMTSKLSMGAEKLGYNMVYAKDGGLDLIKTLENLAQVGADADTINKIFGLEAAKGVNLLIGKMGDLNNNYQEVLNSSGATAQAQKIMEQTVQSQLSILGHNFSNLGKGLGDVLLPAMDKVLRVVNILVRGLSTLINENKLFAKAVVVTVSVLTAGALAVGFLMTKSLALTLVTHGLTAAQTAFAGVQSFVSALMSGKLIPNMILASKNALIMGGSMLKAGVMSAVAFVSANPALMAISLALGAVVASIFFLYQNWERVKTSFQGMNPILDAVLAGINKVFSAFTWLMEKVKGFFKILKQPIPDTVIPKTSSIPQIPGTGTLFPISPSLPSEHGAFLHANAQEFSHFPSFPRVKALAEKVNTGIKQVFKPQATPSTNTVINIETVQIADGVISDLNDFILQLNNAARR
ncbi:phage tail tape measure protein, TP901 family, core region [Brevinema andersonii]|uniref:Phage tail tape measure protein, TP901 family, core region n=1 Tax=Brevinema andersonii TaxID=34097 RepID=A0A1I1EPI8_BREAD|nr:phage tail tape measure protein [Brevinema andersonii]SFB88572.1 phage tail tape measure protein, TP901 family, core region [Brevinema andersonii]